MHQNKRNLNKSQPFTISKKEAYEIVGMPRLVQRWLYATLHAETPEEQWLDIVSKGGPGRPARIDFQSLEKAYQRFRKGEEPPLLPCERKQKEDKK